MKKEFKTCPKVIDETKLYGFSWIEHVACIPTPLIVVTTYKENGLTNATLQAWSTFVSEQGFFVIFGSVNKNKHMYQTIKRRGSLVVNFPSIDIYMKCYETIKHNRDDDDEIKMAELQYEHASCVDAPRLNECFLNLECTYVWEKEITPGDNHVVMCCKVINVVMDSDYYDPSIKGRYNDTGFLYNIHSPRNPETGKEEETEVGIIRKAGTYQDLTDKYMKNK